ncbi:MAG TPA: hypothetical protein VNN77_18110 [candidate division Zixibacteria bacterium]|nr:hypothetical protein [candidate division Zixibacteria bacterium]
MLRRSSFFLSGFGTLAALPAQALACAVCITGAGADGSGDAFNWSVLFLMSAPYLVVGSIAGWLLYRHRRAGRLEAAERNGALVRLVWDHHKESGR